MVFELNIIELVQTAGYAGLFAIIFAESGLLIGFFLPGDSLLFTAGLLSSQGFLDIFFLLIILSAGAILGDSVGYWTGKKFGKKLFERHNSRLFKKERLVQAQTFYAKHGGKTIMLARFMPFIRTFAPIAAGIADMKYRTFLSYNIIGGIFWVVVLTLAGFFLGRSLPGSIDQYIFPIIGVIIIISFLPAVIHVLADKESRRKMFGMLKRTA